MVTNLSNDPKLGLWSTFGFMLCALLFFFVSCGESTARALPKNPKRIAVLNLLAAKLIWGFGQKYQAHVIGLPNTIEKKQYSDMVGRWPAEIPRIGGTAEEILLTEPDLVILASFNSIALRGAIAKLNIPYLLLKNFTGFAGYKENVRKISAAVGAIPQGRQCIQQFVDRLEKIQLKAKQNKSLAKLNVLSYSYDSFAGAQTSFDDIVKASGLNNLAVSKDITGMRKGSQEEILMWNPDVIVIGCVTSQCKHKENLFKKRFPSLRNTRAFQNNLIVAIADTYLTSIDDNMLKVAELLQARVLSASP